MWWFQIYVTLFQFPVQVEAIRKMFFFFDFTNTYYHPSPAHIRRKNPVSDGRVLIDLNTYQSLDEGQRDMLKEHGLVINIVNSQ